LRDPLFVLVHSPLVGPSTWEWVARELESRDRSAVVPSLLGVADDPDPARRIVREVVDARSAHQAGTVVLVGHSGAGLLLPAIARSFAAEVAAMVFVDAFLPPAHGTAPLVPTEFMEQLSALARHDVLPPWSTWFGEGVMRELVPDDARRARVEQDMPRLPLSFLQTEMPVPAGWDRRPCAYLLLSPEPYAPAAADARARGWPVADIDGGNHLDLVRRPATVAAALLDLERRMAASE
jgi:pimeloyl-ACP methyl ester carboxylesterase